MCICTFYIGPWPALERRRFYMHTSHFNVQKGQGLTEVCAATIERDLANRLSCLELHVYRLCFSQVYYAFHRWSSFVASLCKFNSYNSRSQTCTALIYPREYTLSTDWDKQRGFCGPAICTYTRMMRKHTCTIHVNYLDSVIVHCFGCHHCYTVHFT